MQNFKCKISDQGKTLTVNVQESFAGLAISIEGCGEYSSTGDGVPILLECIDGIPRLVVWADITREDPTHIIDLSGAMIKNR